MLINSTIGKSRMIYAIFFKELCIFKKDRGERSINKVTRDTFQLEIT